MASKQIIHGDRAHVSGVEGIMLRDVLPKREKMWWHYPKLRLLNFLLLGAIVSDITNGYDGSMLNGLQIIPEWQDFFNHPAGSRLGVLSNGVRIGQIGAMFITSWVITKFGRRWPIAIGSSILIVGVVVQTASQNFASFVIGRVLIGFGNMIQQTTCPILVAELAYPSQRTQITGIMNSTGSIGQVMAAWITYGTAFMVGSTWSWRLPSALQAISSLFQLAMVWFLPESPRWLVFNNRREEAWKILAKYHAEGDENSELLKFEMAEIDNAIEMDKMQSTSSWLEWFRTPANRYRLFIVTTVGFMIQWCGNALISYYLHLVLNSIGILGTKPQLLINGGITISGIFWGMFFSLIIDRVGRRPMFLIGFGGMFVAFTIFTILTGVNQGINYANSAMGSASVAMIFLFYAFYKMPGPMVPSYVAEVSPYDLRSKGFVIMQFGDAGANLFSGFVNPIALEAIAWKYYIVWCCMLVSNFLITFFFFPETKSLSLEEVTQLFDRDFAETKMADEEVAGGNKAVEGQTVETVRHVE